MPLPVDTVVVHVKIVTGPDGDGATGRVVFRQTWAYTDSTGHVILGPRDWPAILGSTDDRAVQSPALEDGEAYIELPVNDQSGVTPTGAELGVQVRTNVWTDDGVCAVPSGGSTLEFDAIYVSGSTTPSPGTTYATVGQLSSHVDATIDVHGIDDTSLLAERYASMTFDPSALSNGAIPATTDTGETITTFASAASPAPLVISSGHIAHTPYSGSSSAGYMQVQLEGRVRRIGALIQWPTSAIGVAAIIIPSSAWDSSIPSNAGFHMAINGNGIWTLSRYIAGSGTSAIATNATHGRWNTVWGTGLQPFDFWIDPDSSTAVLVWPDGTSTKVSSAFFASETADYAIWELFESNGATDVPAVFGRIWASTQPAPAHQAYDTPQRRIVADNPAVYSTSGAVTVTFTNTSMHVVTLTGNITSLTLAGTTPRGAILHLELVQGGSGSNTLSSPASTIKWAGAAAPTLSTTTGRRDIFRFRYDGSNWLEVSRSMNVSA